jgi:Protein of unknown function (DUF2507).
MSQRLYEQLLHDSAGLPQSVLRDVLIPAVLDKETDGILYWAGKDLARQFPVESTSSIVALFDQLGFGHLKLKKQTSKQQIWLLDGQLVTDRLTLPRPNFTLEAGFLAQQIELQTNATTEAQVTEQKKTWSKS